MKKEEGQPSPTPERGTISLGELKEYMGRFIGRYDEPRLIQPAK